MRHLRSGHTERKAMGEKEIPQLSFTSEEVENGSALRMMSSERVCVYCVPDVVPVLVEKGLWEKKREYGERWSESMRERGKIGDGCVSFCFVLSTHAPAQSPISMWLDDVMVCWYWLDTHNNYFTHIKKWTHTQMCDLGCHYEFLLWTSVVIMLQFQ